MGGSGLTDLDGGYVPRGGGYDPYSSGSGSSDSEFEYELDESFDEYGSQGSGPQDAYLDLDRSRSGRSRRAGRDLFAHGDTDSRRLPRHAQMGYSASRSSGFAQHRLGSDAPRTRRKKRRGLRPRVSDQRVSGVRVNVGERQRVVSGAVVNVGRPHPVVSGARVDVTGGRGGKLLRTITTASGIDRRIEVAGRDAEKTTRKTEQLFAETKVLIRDHLVASNQLGAAHTVHDISLSLDYTKMEATWKGPDGQVHKLDLSTKTELQSGAQIHKKMEETLKLNKDYTPKGGGELHTYSPGIHGPSSGRGAFVTSVGLGTTFAQFAKDDLQNLTGPMTAVRAQRIATQMSTADMYHRGMDKKLVAITNNLKAELRRYKAQGVVSDRTRELQHNIALLDKRIQILHEIHREAAYFVATQRPTVAGAPNRIMGAQRVSATARAYLMNQKKITTSRSFTKPSSWIRGKAGEFTPAQTCFIEGLGAMTLPLRDRHGYMNHREFNAYTRQQQLGGGFSTGLERGFLLENMALHSRGPDATGRLPLPAGEEFFTAGLKGATVGPSIMDALQDIQTETAALHAAIQQPAAVTQAQTPGQAIDRVSTLLEYHLGQLALR